jgi:diguanylate cyclase (GGDEF)-like protein
VVSQSLQLSVEDRYTLLGALFGCLFPLGALLLLALASPAPAIGALAWLRQAHATNPLLWVIETAPFFLGVFARFAGVRQARLQRLNEELERQVEGKTLSLRAALEEAEQANDFINHMAEHDPLTGLYNRRRFQREIEQCVSRAKRYGHAVALLFIDLDAFKPINDQHGHEAGDAFLVAFTGLLTDRLRTTDLVARWGGDEFLVLIPEAEDGSANGVAERLLERMQAARFDLGQARVTPQASIGLALFPQDAADADGLVAAADLAMYLAKEAGGNCWQGVRPGAPPPVAHPPRARRAQLTNP